MDDPTIIDVRDPEKYDAKHVKGAINHSHTKILAGEGPDLPKDAPIVTYCGSGNKAARMKAELERQGYTNVQSTSLPKLEKAGKPTEGSDGH